MPSPRQHREPCVHCLRPGYAQLPDGLKFVYAMVALLSEGKFDMIISAPSLGVEMENLRPVRDELPAMWSDISNAMRGFKDHSLHMLVLDEVLGLELSKFSRQLKLKPGIDDDHRVIVAMSNDLWFRGKEVKEEGERRNNSKETRAHLEAMVLRTKPEANKWLHLTPRIAALGADAFERGPVMIRKTHAYLEKEVNLAENAEEKSAEFVNRVCQVTVEAFWSQNVRREEGFDRTEERLSLLGAAPNRQNLKAVIFTSRRLLQSLSPVLPICLRIARARPTKILRAITFPKNDLDFNPHKPVTNSFSI